MRRGLIWIKAALRISRHLAAMKMKGAVMEPGTAPLAWGLTRGMAWATGVNLSQAVTDGWFSRRELSQLLGACAACDASVRCSNWLAKTPKPTALPSFCSNKSDIEALSF
jgi:hypothetical protein